MKEVIVLASDHNGVVEKTNVKQFLKEQGYQCIDLGPYETSNKVDYVDYAAQLGTIISNGDAAKGILVCGTGVGMSIVVNRFPNVRAVLAHNMLTAVKSREHNNSNVLCLGAWLTQGDDTKTMVAAWLNEPWGEGRHVKRVERIDPKTGVVLANGVFDVLHKGHIELLKFAKSQGTHLVVAIDSDSRVKSLKGENRPINNEDDRKKLLEAIGYVDEVVIFDSAEELRELYKNVNPSVIVKGGEWTAEEVRLRDQIPEEIIVKIYPIVDNYSTTNTLKKIQALTTCEKKF
jgi:ribose 5-phosphate isomerase B